MIKINYIDFKEDKIIIGWSASNIGFGQLTIYKRADDEFDFDTECMSNEFRDRVLDEMVKYLKSFG